MNPQVDQYLADGCGRCELYASPGCKINQWRREMTLLRKILLGCGLKEELKWSVACYTFQGRNVVLMSAFKKYAALAFFKGTLLKDDQKLLVKPGENSRAVRQFRFTNTETISNMEDTIKAYVLEAVEIEKAVKKVEFKKAPDALPEELLRKFQEFPELKIAFYALTPGRQRGYLLYFSQAKQSKTRKSRIEKYIPQILAGKGFHDR